MANHKFLDNTPYLPSYTSTRVLLLIYGLRLSFGALSGLYKGKANTSGYVFIVGFIFLLLARLLPGGGIRKGRGVEKV